MNTLLIIALLILFGLVPAHAFSDAELIERYCAGMNTQFNNPDHTRTDCISGTHAIEVDFSKDFKTALGQALHYALWTKDIAENPDTWARWYRQVPTPRKAGIIFTCSEDRRLETCADQVVRMKRIVEEYHLPLTIWDCNPKEDMALGDCLKIDYP
ncbi:hypothetical protein [Mesorhizobium sp.]|uniref:hypothetical protein n=1 Tax=Mesorhizobium sp. TaxID=1871066 RepID=UPI000FEA0288|nr:hypothetical protein [Mesorhizobium sp.]RWK43742.1 MAG: hypothetical protein EOR46_04655 [Mesorhizobium sp.]